MGASGQLAFVAFQAEHPSRNLDLTASPWDRGGLLKAGHW